MKKSIILSIIFLAFLLYAGSAFAQKTKARINHIAIYVVDIKKSTEFYRDIIGLDTIPEPFHDGKHTWLRMGPQASVHIIEGAAAKKEYFKNNHICFSVGSVEQFTETLRKYNFTWEDAGGKKMSISSRPDGVKQIWLQDPDGYWIEINDAKD